MTQPTPTPVPTPPPAPAPTPPGDPANPAPPKEEPLGPAGIKALQQEREAREALEREMAPLKELAKALTGGKPPAGKSEIDLINEKLAEQAETIKQQAVSLLRADVAADKELTAQQAAMLVGSTREELAAYADKLIELFGKPAVDPATQRKSGTPRPDPAQGARPGEKPTGKDAGLAEARKRFGTKTA